MGILDGFIEDHSDILERTPYVTLREAWELYKKYVEDANLAYTFSMIRFREELKSYFGNYTERELIDGMETRNVYRNFKQENN